MILKDVPSFWQIFTTKPTFKVASLDVGTKKIGIATYNSIVQVVTPLPIFTRLGDNSDVGKLIDILKENKIEGLIIGMPLTLNGDLGKNSNNVTKLAERILNLHDIPIIFVDERFTTKLANSMLKQIDVSRKKRNQVDDQLAAMILLEDFLKTKPA
jgi:putative Holliday junction resolvase